MTNPLYDPYAVLRRVYGEGMYLKEALRETPVEEMNRARTSKICYGVLENSLYFDYCIAAFAERTPKLPVRIVLKIGLYMILRMEKSRYMVTDNAVSLLKKLGKGGAAGFANAFLRRFEEERIVLPEYPAERLSVKRSVPRFLAEKILAGYGAEEAEKILAPQPARTFVRFPDPAAARDYASLPSEETPFPNLKAYPNFRMDDGFREGKYTFQSAGSVAVCDAVSPCGELLDACAGPGGKSVLLAEKCGKVMAFELHPHRADLIRSYCARMRAANVETVCRDSAVHDPAYDGRFDAVLLDVPCSGTGVMGENPDIRIFRKEEDLPAIRKTQRALLEACAPYVKGGGMLYYSTCSVLPEENEEQVAAFLSRHGEFFPEKKDSPLAHRETALGMQFLPHLSMGAGFYVCRLRRKP